MGFGYLYEHLCWSTPRGWVSFHTDQHKSASSSGCTNGVRRVLCSQLTWAVVKTEEINCSQPNHRVTLWTKIGRIFYISPLYTARILNRNNWKNHFSTGSAVDFSKRPSVSVSIEIGNKLRSREFVCWHGISRHEGNSVKRVFYCFRTTSESRTSRYSTNLTCNRHTV